MPVNQGFYQSVGWLCSGLLLLGLFVSGCVQEEPGSKYLVLLEMTASDCGDCQEIHRIVQNIKPQYHHKIRFVTVDVSSPSTRLYAQKTGRRFNSQVFVKKYQDRPGTVAVLSATNGVKLGMLQNDLEEAHYREMLDSALERVPH